MAAPGWFTHAVHQWVLEVQSRAAMGESTDLNEAALELWAKVTGHSEKQLAKALEEVLGGKELPIALQGDMVHRVHVERIAKYLVNRGTILDEEPDLFPAPIRDSHTEGVAYERERQPWSPRRGKLVGGPSFEDQQREQRMARDDRRIRETEGSGRVGFVDDEGRVR